MNEFGDRIGFIGLVYDFYFGWANAIAFTEAAGATFPHLPALHPAMDMFQSPIDTGFVPTVGIFDMDGNLVQGPVSGGLNGYRAAIESVLSK